MIGNGIDSTILFNAVLIRKLSIFYPLVFSYSIYYTVRLGFNLSQGAIEILN